MYYTYSTYAVVSPSDTVDLPKGANADGMATGLIVTAAGTLSILDPAGNTVAIAGTVVGQFLPLKVKRVRATGTSATVIAVYPV